MIKKCVKCSCEKDSNEFRKHKHTADGLNSWCKDCTKKYHQAYYNKNKSKLLLKSIIYNHQNREKVNQYQKDYYNSHIQDRKYYEQQYRLSHKDEKRAYAQNNIDRIRKNCRKYNYQRYHTDPLFKLKRNLCGRISQALTRKGYTKKSKTCQLLGCSYEHAKNWLEYTWFLNYGTEYVGQEVEIDHIKPNEWATTEEELITFQHISNLQYLTPDDNLLKLNNYSI